MINFITVACLLVTVGWPAILNILAYPVSKKVSIKISDHIVKVTAPQIFSVLSLYKNFHFVGYPDNKSSLPDQFMIISNHQSLIDIPLYMNFLRDRNLRFVAKDELARHVPLVSEMLRAHEHCMIPRRGSPAVAMRTLESFGRRVLARNQIPVLFPEGTRSKDGTVGQFYAAGFRRLSETVRLPVVVCALDGGYRINNISNIMTNIHNGSYRVKILKVFPAPEGKRAQMEVLNGAHELITAQLAEWRS